MAVIAPAIFLGAFMAAFGNHFLGWPGAIGAAIAFGGLTAVPCLLYFWTLDRTADDTPRMVWFYLFAVFFSSVVTMTGVYLIGAEYVVL